MGVICYIVFVAFYTEQLRVINIVFIVREEPLLCT